MDKESPLVTPDSFVPITKVDGTKLMVAMTDEAIELARVAQKAVTNTSAGITEDVVDTVAHVVNRFWEITPNQDDLDSWAKEFAEDYVSPLMEDRLAWLEVDPRNRLLLCDEAVEEYGPAKRVSQQIGQGWKLATERIAEAVGEILLAESQG